MSDAPSPLDFAAQDQKDADDGLPQDLRRARMKDVFRLRDHVKTLEGKVDALQAALDANTGRMTRVQFMGQFFASAAAWDGSKTKFFRDWAEAAYLAYCAACDGTPAPGILASYGGHAPEPIPEVTLVGPASMAIAPEPAKATA